MVHFGNQEYKGLSTDTKPVPADTAVNALFEELDTGDKYINNGTAWLLQVGAGGGLSAGGQISFNGTASQTLFNIPHGLSQTPDFISVQPASPDAFGSFTRTKDATNIIITYQIPPPLGTSNVTFQWGAGFVSEDIEIGLSSSSTTTFTNKTIDLTSNTIPKIGPERWYIYREGTGTTGPYYALNKRIGEVVYSGPSFDAVLDSVLTDVEAGDQGTVTTFLSSGGHIYIDGTDTYYYCSAGFDGFTIPQYTTIEGPHNARILVPNGYTGYVFRIPSWFQINPTKYTSSSPGMRIRGLSLAEAGTAVRAWTGVLVEGYADPTTGSGGVTASGASDTRMIDCKTGLMLNQVNSRGWITNCYFEKLYISRPKWAGVDQQLFGADPVNEFGNNVFRDIAVQSTSEHPAYGFRNMGHRRCIYDNCIVWDIQPGQIKATFDTTTRSGVIITEDNLILGGNLTQSYGMPSSGTFSAGHSLVLAGYYSAGVAYPFYFQDGAINTTIIGSYNIGSQLKKIYVPIDTGTLSVEGRKVGSNTILEIQGSDDASQSQTSWWNNSKSERMFLTKTASSCEIQITKQTAGGTLRPLLFRMNDVPGASNIEAFRILTSGNLQMGDGRDIALGTTTGTKIGNATTQKLGFFNKTPIIQPAAITSPAADVASLKTAVDALRTALTNLGLTA